MTGLKKHSSTELEDGEQLEPPAEDGNDERTHTQMSSLLKILWQSFSLEGRNKKRGGGSGVEG